MDAKLKMEKYKIAGSKNRRGNIHYGSQSQSMSLLSQIFRWCGLCGSTLPWHPQPIIMEDAVLFNVSSVGSREELKEEFFKLKIQLREFIISLVINKTFLQYLQRFWDFDKLIFYQFNSVSKFLELREIQHFFKNVQEIYKKKVNRKTENRIKNSK